MQNRIAELFYDRLQPRMSVLFDELADVNHSIKIDTLEIDCSIIPGKHWEEEWVDTVLSRLKQALNALPKNKTLPAETNNQFFFFLEAGYFSWNHSAKTISQLEEAVFPDQFFFEKLEEILRKSITARKRLINQFSQNFLKRLVDAYLKDGHTTLEKYYAKEYSVLFTTGNLKDTLLEIFADDKLTASLALKKVDNGIENPIVEKEIKSKQSKDVYVNNAGLVLLHPFLTALFEELKLTKDNQWINEEAQQKAILISECLVTGKKEFSEFNLPLNKIISGVDVENALEINISINARIEDACEELLTEVIGHWSVLKNTGIESLRETFLQRNGKLTPVDKGWLLQVEQKAVDVLLGKLPWGIGIVKLPWMKEIIYVEWV